MLSKKKAKVTRRMLALNWIKMTLHFLLKMQVSKRKRMEAQQKEIRRTLRRRTTDSKRRIMDKVSFVFLFLFLLSSFCSF